MKEDTKKLARHRIARSWNAFQEGDALFEKKFYSGAVNRFYYAAFYAARALLATKQLDSSKHSGVISLFHEHFVGTGLVDKEKSKALSRSFEQRQDSDYEDFILIHEEECKALKRLVEVFIQDCDRAFKQIL